MNTQTRGWATEASVIAKCITKGYRVSVPFGDHAPYDFVLDVNGKLLRIQVKMIYKAYSKRKGYVANFKKARCVNGRNRHYTKEDCDFIISYSNEHDVAFIFPVEKIIDRWSAFVYPKKSERKNTSHLFSEDYREAWSLLDNGKEDKVINLSK